MPIEFRCHHCGSLLRTPDGTAGQTAQCPRCGTQMPIPGPPAVEVWPADQPPPESASEADRASPFGPVAVEGSGQPDPYVSASAYGSAPGFGMAVDRAAAAARVAGPATALLVMAILGIPLQLLAMAGNMLQITLVPVFQPGAQDMPAELQVFSGAVGMFAGVVSLALAIVMLVGALRMKHLTHYGWAMAAAIIAVIPCFSSCCCLLEIPFGIWALVVLSDPSVKAAFRA